MQALSPEKTTTKETALQKKLIEKRNLFGLGVTSLIAACSGADGAGGGETEEERIAREAEEAAQTARADALPFEAGKLTAAQANGYSAEIETAGDFTGVGATADLDVKITKGGEAPVFLNFPTGGLIDKNTANIHKLTPNLGQYDLVISAPVIDKDDLKDEISKGRIFIYWDVAKVAAAPDPKASTHLEIKGAKRSDNIGISAPDFLKIGGTDNKYDMIIRSDAVDKEGDGGKSEEGAIYILWDIVDYDEATKTIDLNPIELGNATSGATSGSLAILGARVEAQIGIHIPKFLQIGGAGNNYDMVIRSHEVNKSASNEGAIYILWDVEDYHNTNTGSLYHAIDLGTSITGATSGSLAILGAKRADNIGIYAPDFLKIGGTDNKDDMVIRSNVVDKRGNGADPNTNDGAIYILWDVAEYAGKNETIDLGKLGTDDENATSGSLAIIGANIADNIGTHAPEFLQIGGKDNNYDIVIRSKWVDKLGNSRNSGAIYVLWDVADYYSTQAIPNNTTIDLSAFYNQNLYATSGLLTIYGAYTTPQLAMYEGLGSDANNVLYNADGELTNIDGDKDNGGTKDIAFQDKDYTYVLFGDKIATTTGDGDNKRVTSKIVDLDAIDKALSNGGEGFFNYTFFASGLGIATASTSATDRVGYRFADRSHTTLADVQGSSPFSAPLSDADADLGAWDIA